MRLLKKMIIIGLIIILIPGTMLSSEKHDIIVKALLDTKARPDQYDIVDWSIINQKHMTLKEMEELCKNIAKSFTSNQQNFMLTQESDEMYRIVIMEGMLDFNTFLQVTMQSIKLPEQYQKEPQTYLVVSITSKDFDKKGQFEVKVKDIISSKGGKSNISTCVVGSFDGKLDKESQSKLLQTLIDKLELTYVKEYQKDSCCSLIGYCPYLIDSIEIFEKSYNIDIDIRYNCEDDITYIWIGTPIISTKY